MKNNSRKGEKCLKGKENFIKNICQNYFTPKKYIDLKRILRKNSMKEKSVA